MRNSIAVATALLLAMGQGIAWAQSAADKAAADALFNEGKRLIGAGDVEPACAKFEASLARVLQLGTQLALASCYERLGKTASAWGEFRAAASAAARARDEQRQHFAEERAAAIEPRLSMLVIRVEPGYRIDGLQVKRDGMDVATAELGSPVPVDPGDHAVEANAPGWVAWSTKVSVAPMPGVVEVLVPALGKAPVKVEEPKPPPAVAPPPPPAPPPAPHRRPYLAYGLAGGGTAVLATSLVLGAMAGSRWSAAQPNCRDRVCNPTGFDQASSARSLGNLSTVTFVVGAAAVSAGVVLLLLSPGKTESPRAASWRVVPAVAAGQAGLAMQGGF